MWAGGDTLEGVADQRRDVVRQHDPAITCGPSEYGRIIGNRQTYVLDANDISRGPEGADEDHERCRS